MSAKIILKAGKQEIIKRGHPWVFSGAIHRVIGSCQSGDVVLLCDSNQNPLAQGFYNPNSDITFRLLSLNPNIDINSDFWRERIKSAITLRERMIPAATNGYRVINAEGDFMPGLIVDRYGEALVLSIHVFGMERLRPLLLEILQEELQPRLIYERSEGKNRIREGLPERCEWTTGAGQDQFIIQENGLSFQVDPVAGQKTGFFLDQRDNRSLLQSVSKGLKVLNCFSFSGGFSLYAIRGGAQSVTSVDISEPANNLARNNLQLNKMESASHPVVTADIFEYLRKIEQPFDLVVLDPPAFAKSQKEVLRASRGYKDINYNAVKKLGRDGLLMTFSCSNHMDEPLFQKIVLSAVNDAGRSAQVLKVLGPGPDHPFNLAHQEGRYLKGLLLRIS
jgi:23S rRNA (cytosine1962-C5)-methyltransferase